MEVTAMQLTVLRHSASRRQARKNAGLKPSPSRSAMAEHGRQRLAILVAGMAIAGFLVPCSVAAIELETTVWNKYSNAVPTNSNTTSTDGRIPLGTSGGDVTHAAGPTVIKDGSTYKMWYAGLSGNWRIYYATSPDGLTWTKYSNAIPAPSDTTSTDGRIPLGTAGKGDVSGVAFPTAIKDGSTYKMWYVGYDGTNWRIYYATSPNGLTWAKYDNTIPAPSDTISTNGRIPLGTAGKGDDVYAYTPIVIKEDDSTYKMWYTGYDGTNWRIYYATSPDGLTWAKYNNAVPTNSDTTSSDGRIPLGTSGTGDDTFVLTQTVIKEGSTYKMWYGGSTDGANYRIYYATSPDGLTWTKYNNAVPTNSDTTSSDGRIPLGTNTKGDDAYVAFPTVINEGVNKMWYGGHDGVNWRIYHVRGVPPAGTFLTIH
ncbi:MAG: hypothetical protein HYV36_00235 [Lentisphaerae bacterium]|nr:hypothetical protein [Lentisphaerota bacterium]